VGKNGCEVGIIGGCLKGNCSHGPYCFLRVRMCGVEAEYLFLFAGLFHVEAHVPVAEPVARDIVDDLLLRGDHRLDEALPDCPIENAEAGSCTMGERELRGGCADAQEPDVVERNVEKMFRLMDGRSGELA